MLVAVQPDLLARGLTAATAQEPGVTLRAEKVRLGLTRLGVAGPEGTEVSLVELVGGRERGLGDVIVRGTTNTPGPLVRWRCDRRIRRIRARGVTPDGRRLEAAVEVRTASCRHRLAAAWPGRIRAGQAIVLRVRDRWGLGDLQGRICFTPPGGLPACRKLRVPARVGRARWPLHARRPGRWRMWLVVPSIGRVADRVLVAHPGRRLILLATGDSEIQVLDEMLAARLRSRHVTVKSDARVSTGISKLAMFNWVQHAGRQARRLRPDVTVMFIGANDGFALRVGRGYVSCCGAAWTVAYARLTRRMMAAYARRGAGRVYWFLLPAPRSRRSAGYFAAINAGFRQAAATLPGDVRIIDAFRVFTPGGRFRMRLRDGRRVRTVRSSDGYHLSPSGDDIAARLVIRAMREDMLIG